MYEDIKPVFEGLSNLEQGPGWIDLVPETSNLTSMSYIYYVSIYIYYVYIYIHVYVYTYASIYICMNQNNPKTHCGL